MSSAGGKEGRLGGSSADGEEECVAGAVAVAAAVAVAVDVDTAGPAVVVVEGQRRRRRRRRRAIYVVGGLVGEPAATTRPSKKTKMNPSGHQVQKTTVAGHPDSEEAKVVALLKTEKHVPLPFRLIDEYGVFGCSYENGLKLREYFCKAFPAATVTQAIITAPYIIVQCAKIPSGLLPFTVGGLPIIFTTKEYPWGLQYKLGTSAQKRERIVTSLNLRTKDKVTDEAIRTIADELQQLHLRPTEIGFMSGICRLAFPHSVDLTEIPYRIAGCSVYVQFHSVTTAARRMNVPFDKDTNDYLAHADRTLRPGVMFSSSFCDNSTQHLSTTSGLLVKDAEGQHYVTCALHGFLEDGIVFHPDPIKGRQIGKVVQRFPNVDVGLVRLEPGIRYTNEFFESRSGASGVTPRRFTLSKYGDCLEMDNPYSGSCAATVVGVNSVLEGTVYHRHDWQFFERGIAANEGSCGSPILDENGRVASIFRFVDKEDPKCGFGVTGVAVENLGLELVDKHVF